MDFKKFVSDVSTSFNRAVQYTEEKLGTSERTEFDADFESLCQRGDKLTEACTKIIAACEAYLQPNPAHRVEGYVSDKLQSITQKKHDVSTPSDELAAVLTQAANDLGPAMPYGEALLKASESQRKLGAIEKAFVADVEANYLSVIKQFMENENKNVQKERSTLNARRLDLDASKNKLKKAKQSAPSQPQLEKEVEACQAAFDKQLETTRLLLEGVTSAYDVHHRALAHLIRAEMEYHTKCAESLSAASQLIGNANA